MMPRPRSFPDFQVKECDVLIWMMSKHGGFYFRGNKVVKENGAVGRVFSFVHPSFHPTAERLASLPSSTHHQRFGPISEENLKILKGPLTVLSVAELLGE